MQKEQISTYLLLLFVILVKQKLITLKDKYKSLYFYESHEVLFELQILKMISWLSYLISFKACTSLPSLLSKNALAVSYNSDSANQLMLPGTCSTWH